MFTVNKYETGYGQFGSKASPKETSVTNFNKNWQGLKYNINGSGRDTYIYNDNGGFGAMFRPREQENAGQFLPNVNRAPDAAVKYSSVQNTAKSIRYKTDGTGRDSYVTTGDGGFTNPHRAIALDPRVAFARSLRGYEQDPEYLARRTKRQQQKKQNRNQSHIIGSPRAGKDFFERERGSMHHQIYDGMTEKFNPNSSFNQSHLAGQALRDQNNFGSDGLQSSLNDMIQNRVLNNTCKDRLQPLRAEPDLQYTLSKQKNQLEHQSHIDKRGQRGSQLMVNQKKNYSQQKRNYNNRTSNPNQQQLRLDINTETMDFSATNIISASTTMKQSFLTSHSPNQKTKVHRNSVLRSPLAKNEPVPPSMPGQNPQQEHFDKMARYLNRMDSRLSQPKLYSPGRRQSCQDSVASLRQSFEQATTSPRSPTFDKKIMMIATDPSKAEKQKFASRNTSGFERRNNSVIMKNNSIAELYQESGLKKIAKPSLNLRNSMTNGFTDNTATSPTKTLMKDFRSGSIDNHASSPMRLLNKDNVLA